MGSGGATTSVRTRLSVGDRINLSFVIAAALPLLLLASISYYMVTQRLEQAALNDAQQLAKSMGMDIFERLQFLTDHLRLLAAKGDETGQAGVADPALGLNLGDRVRFLFRFVPGDAATSDGPLSPADRALLRASVDAVEKPGPLLFAFPGPSAQRFFLLVPLPAARGPGFVGAELDTVHLWDTTGIAERPERVCVLDEHGRPVYCNKPNGATWVDNSASLVASRGRPAPLDDGHGEPMLTAAWSLFLQPFYQFERWTVLVGIPSSQALSAIKTFDRVFAGTAAVALMLGYLLARRMIGRNLKPLQALTVATDRLGRGEFSARVHLDSGDEFERLGDAFDAMASRIGDQFDQLDAFARLDRALQVTTQIDGAITAAASALDYLMGERRCGIVCEELWQNPGRIWCRPLRDEAVGQCPATGDDLSTEQIKSCAMGRDDWGDPRSLQVLPVVDNDLVRAHIVVPVPTEGERRQISRVADVLAIALSKLATDSMLMHRANHDWLTGLPNRARFRELFEAAMNDSAGSASTLGLLLVGLDRFKQVNDSIGHSAGDRLLMRVGQRLRETLPGAVVLSRFSGDQFILMVEGDDPVTVTETVDELSGQIKRALDSPITLGSRSMRLTSTHSSALYPRDADSFEGLLQCLDAAGYVAKASRRGGLLHFTPGMRDSLVGRMDVEQALKGAVANNELVLHYQPVIDVRSGQVASAEALIRWQRPGVGLVMPGGFIEVAEQSGLIAELGAWALFEVCRQMVAWQATGLSLKTLNVNLSSVQLSSDDIERQVAAALLETGLEPACLTLEVTETALIGRFEEGVERLKRLQQLGVQILVDDFGTGYASLKYLKLLPIDGLKIDRLFVKDLPDSVSDEAIVTALVSLARASNFKLVAEGIETDAQAGLLARAGVPYFQGYLYSKPLPVDEFYDFCARGPREQAALGRPSAATAS
ncbi:MAG: EAL domain-containing protein [Gammaproteobacteria bacterium]|nr:EAL domain-containing protein [Gammaproteobacteria bacterium]